MASVLTPHGQTAPVPQTTVRANLDEAPNVALNFSFKVSLNLEVSVEHFAQAADLGFGQIPHLLAQIDISLFTKRNDIVLADAVKNGKRILRRLIPRKID